MTTMILGFAAVAAALTAVAWWIRRENLAVYPVGRSPRELRPLPAGCDLGAQLMAAADVGKDSSGSAGSAGGAAASEPAPAKPTKQRRKPFSPDRRAFLRNSWLFGWLGTLAGFGGASIAFLWPDAAGGFGARIRVGPPEDVLSAIREAQAPFAFPAGRMYIVEYDPALDPDGQYEEITGGSNLMALYQKCVHLGCKVPWCQTSQWFECPCHGSRYNRWGEWKDGPAPRGLDRFPITVEQGEVFVNTGDLRTGPSRQAVVLDQEREGPSCL
ncbi:MAG TPA: Rieske 2Fe-2S domain-containing protein [Egibacteraceae bacterium]|nr:Rieske 2Fe-2S domain-containing protein [Egibacteraceae bacterium]